MAVVPRRPSARGPEGADRGIERLGALGSGIVYAVPRAVAVQILTGPGSSGGGAKKTAGDVFSWPAGRWLVGLAGVVVAGVAIYQFIRGVRHKLLDDSKTEQMAPTFKSWFTMFGTIGHVARAVVLGLVAVFLLKAAYVMQGERGDRTRRRAREALRHLRRPLPAEAS